MTEHQANKVLDIDGIRVVIQNQCLLDDVSAHVNAGEIVAVIGPNGAGKSTLLKAVMHDCAIEKGHIHINQSGISQTHHQARQVAALPQFSLLNFPYTAYEVVALSRIPHKTGLDIDKTIINEAMAAMDINHLADQSYTTLSGGEKQRVQLARVLAQIWRAEDTEPDTHRLLLLDEPTTALDLGHQQLLMQTLRQFAKSANNTVAILMVLHDVNLAARYADRLVALLDGQLLFEGQPKQVLTQSNLRRLFGIEVKIIEHPDHGTPMILNA